MSSFLATCFQFFLPPQCPCCEALLPEGHEGFCQDCSSKIRWIEPPFCPRCGIPFPLRTGRDHLCGACTDRERHFTRSRALGSYEGPLREAIHRWKYEGKTTPTPIFGGWMLKGFLQHWKISDIDLLIPVPLHPQRLRERGFNQALLLAQALSRRTGIPCPRRILEKKRPTAPQVRLSGTERERAVKGTFSLREAEILKEKTILLIDDVYTTGATVSECARILLAQGAKRVDVLTLAHTLMVSEQAEAMRS